MHKELLLMYKTIFLALGIYFWNIDNLEVNYGVLTKLWRIIIIFKFSYCEAPEKSIVIWVSFISLNLFSILEKHNMWLLRHFPKNLAMFNKAQRVCF